MFLLFGTRAFTTLMTTVTFVCHFCGVSAPQQVIKRATRFTLFFLLPLFPLGTTYFVQCTNCGGVTPLTREQAQHGQEWAASHRVQ